MNEALLCVHRAAEEDQIIHGKPLQIMPALKTFGGICPKDFSI